MPAFKMTYQQLEALPNDEALVPILQKRGCNIHWDDVKQKIVPNLQWFDNGVTRIFYWDQGKPENIADIPIYDPVMEMHMYSMSSACIVTSYISSNPWPFSYSGNAAAPPVYQNTQGKSTVPEEWEAPKKKIDIDDSILTSKRSVTLNKDE